MKNLSCAVLVVFILSACSPAYVLRAAYEEGRILAGREKISDALDDPAVSEEMKRKLRLVLKARAFAETLGLDVGESFTRYYQLDRDTFAWVLVASKPDSFTLVTWWYPVTGVVPYKGFFEREDAEEEREMLSKEGYETWIRGTEAISTLGWFNDPVMSTTLSKDDFNIVNTVNHESFHSTVWLPGRIEFNESAANFFGCAAAVRFFEEALDGCGNDAACVEAAEKRVRISRLIYERELDIGDTIGRLYDRLNNLYESNATRDQKLNLREPIFKEEIDPLRRRYPELKALHVINNAEIMQLKLYMTNLRVFEALFTGLRGDFSAFIETIRKIKGQTDDNSDLDPFVLLGESVAELKKEEI